MASRMTRADLDAMIQARGPQFANDYITKYGTEIVDDELPPEGDTFSVYGDEPPPPPPLAVRYNDGEDDIEDDGSVMQRGSPEGLKGWLEQSTRSISDLYDQAAARLQRRYRGPSQGDLLMSMGAALLKPVQGGWREALANMAGAIPQYMQQRREYADATEEQLAKLDMAKAAQLAALQGKYATTAFKAPKAPSQRAYRDPLGRLTHKVYGTTIKDPPPPAILALQQFMADPNNTDAEKEITRRNFDTKFGYGASDIFSGE